MVHSQRLSYLAELNTALPAYGGREGAPKTVFMVGVRVRKRGSTPLKKPPRTRTMATEATMLFCGSSITLITYPSPEQYHTTPTATAAAHQA